MSSIIPTFNFQQVFIDPWQYDAEGVFWITLMGFFVNASCGLVGTFLVLRRMALVGDAISHGILPGIVIAFMLTTSMDILPMLIGAVIAGIVTVALIEIIHKSTRVKPDAALGIVFTSLFAFGVILLSLFADKVHLDLDCVLYGEIGFTPLMETVQLGGVDLGPRTVVQMALVFLVLAIATLLFYKELLITSFDSSLSKTLGISANCFHYSLLILLSITVVSAFEAVGAILVIAMLIMPAVTANLITERLPYILLLTLPFALLYSLAGYHLAVWLNTSIASCMVIVASALFVAVWLFNPKQGLVERMLRKCYRATVS